MGWDGPADKDRFGCVGPLRSVCLALCVFVFVVPPTRIFSALCGQTLYTRHVSGCADTTDETPKHGNRQGDKDGFRSTDRKLPENVLGMA